ncbi:MAG: hypothetical protein ABH849_03005 [Nanoarchaeota archaeon]
MQRALPILGTSGGETRSIYGPLHITRTTPFAVFQRTSLRGTIKEKLDDPEFREELRRLNIDPDSLPVEVLVLGKEEVYHCAPCKSGTVSGRRIHFVGPTSEKIKGRAITYCHSMKLGTFYRLYDRAPFLGEPEVLTVEEAFEPN